MYIAVLSECYLTQGHLDRLRKLGEVKVFENTNTEDLAISRLSGVDIAIADCFVTPMNEHFFDSLSSVKYICINSIGFDPIDVAAARKNGIFISNVPGYSAEAVAEHTIALIFAVLRNIAVLDSHVRSGLFGFDLHDQNMNQFLSFNLKGKTLGIIGLGQIGKYTAQLAEGLGMRVIAYNRSQKEIPNVELVTLNELLRESDIISLHLPLNDETIGIIDREALSLMKSSAIIINTARGKIIDELALIDALQKGVIRGAGLDVISAKDKNNPLLRMKNVVLTPHIGWYTKESLENLAEIIVNNIEHYSRGSMQNLITH